MGKEVLVYKSKIFQEQVNKLTYKENNFVFKKCRALAEMIKANLNISHLEKIEYANFYSPLYLMKTQKDWRVMLTLDDHNKLTFLRMVTLKDIEMSIDTLDLENIYSYDFKEFW